MQLLYRAFACEDIDGNKLLLPGYPAHPDMSRLKPGDIIKVELADGTLLQTTVQGTQLFTFNESMIMNLKLRVGPGFYMAVVVPSNFSAPGIELGANVYLLSADP